MLKSVLLAAIVALVLIASPSWAITGENGTEACTGLMAQNNYGYPDQYGYDHNQMHYQMHSGGGGCGGGNHNMNNMGNYQQNPNYGYQDPNYRYSDPNYQNYGWDGNQSGGGHHH